MDCYWMGAVPKLLLVLLARKLHTHVDPAHWFPAWATLASTLCYYVGVAMWVAVEITVPFGIPIIARHLIFRVPKKGPCS